MSILYWLALGVAAGFIAKVIMPGSGPAGWIMTIVIGVAGAFLGGFIASHLGFGGVRGLDVRSLVIATGGSALLLFLYRRARR
jgi:uncharacterized membrane protein YeaQ/YmgE (transglycosylase-associated protein family)